MYYAKKQPRKEHALEGQAQNGELSCARPSKARLFVGHFLAWYFGCMHM